MINPEIFYFPADATAITPADGSDLPRAGLVYVGGAGDVKITTIGGTDIVFSGMAAGSVVPVRAKKVFAAGTTATNLVLCHDKY